MITVSVAGNREIRQENRKLHRKLRRKRRNERLNRRQDRLQRKLKDSTDSPRGKGAARRERGRAAPAPAPSPRHIRPPRRSAEEAEAWDEEVEEVEQPRPRRRPLRRFREEAPEEAPEELDEELDEGLDEELDEEVGALPSKGARLNLSSLEHGLPVQNSLKVGRLRVVAPIGDRGLVLPLGGNTYLVSHWPRAQVQAHGTQALGRVMLEMARAKLAGAQVGGDEVGVLPLALMILRQRQLAQQAQPPAQPVQPAIAVAGTCACQRR